MQRAALYVRVSTDRQTVENQIARLTEIAMGRGLESLRVLGGRESLEHRHIVILNLADIYKRIGKKPVGTRDSLFAVFCRAIFEAMGWPTGGLDDAIPDAINSLRNLR